MNHLELAHTSCKPYTEDQVDAKLSTVYRCLTEDVVLLDPNDHESIAKINMFFLAELAKFDPLMLKAIDQSVNVFTNHLPKSSRFTDNEIKNISKEYVKIKEISAKRAIVWQGMEDNLKNAKDEYTIFGLIARFAYCPEIRQGKVIQAGNLGFYKASKIIENRQGLRAVFFEPVENDTHIKDTSRSPIFAFRGTSPSNRKNIIDDLQSSIGDRSFLMSREIIKETLIEAKENYPKGTVITGHSLGGALAQRTTAENVGDGVIAKTFHYNAPGVGSFVVNTYKENLKKLGSEILIPEIIDIHHHKDIVYRFGGDHLPTDQRFVLDTTSIISKLASHKLNEVNRLLMSLDGKDCDSKLTSYNVRSQSLKSRMEHNVLELGRTLTSPLLIGIVRAGTFANRVFNNTKQFFGISRGLQVENLQKQMLNLEDRQILTFF